MCPCSSSPSSVSVHKCCETWASWAAAHSTWGPPEVGTGAGERARYRGFGSRAGFDVGQRGSEQALPHQPDSKEPEFTYYRTKANLHSKITHRRCFAAQRQDLKAASLCLPLLLMLLLQSSAVSSTPTLSIRRLELWLHRCVQKGCCCCSTAPGSPSSHSFAVFQTSCCCHRGEPCWQAFFDTCTIQCASGLKSDLIIRKLRRQEKGVKSLCGVPKYTPSISASLQTAYLPLYRYHKHFPVLCISTFWFVQKYRGDSILSTACNS